MDMISRAGLVASVALCAGAGYLFFIPQGAEVADSTTAGLNSVREIARPQGHDEQLNGSMYEFSDNNHFFIFNPDERSYEERYATQHIGEGGFKTFVGMAVPHELKQLQLPFEQDKKYLLLEGISENRVYQIVSETESSLDLQSLNGDIVRLVKKQ